MSVTDIDQEEIDQINSYAAEVNTVFSKEFAGHADRFKAPERLLQRFNDAVCSMFLNGRRLIAGVDESHNELCVASQLLANVATRIAVLEYEPVLPGCAKSIDFRACTDQGLTVYVDVKTIKPKPKDRWDQFAKAGREGWFPENINVVLSKPCLGGELWHNMFTARSRMLEYALELESKIHNCNLVRNDKTIFILALCGEGFHWQENGLEDFVSFYRSGFHRDDDPFSKAEAKTITDKNITLDGTITRFACMKRSQFEIRHQRLNWNVQPPKYPLF
jgi:hypothetical protein